MLHFQKLATVSTCMLVVGIFIVSVIWVLKTKELEAIISLLSSLSALRMQLPPVRNDAG